MAGRAEKVGQTEGPCESHGQDFAPGLGEEGDVLIPEVSVLAPLGDGDTI